MNPDLQFERDLEQWLRAEAPAKAPAGLHAAAIDRAGTLRQRPAWGLWLPARWLGRGRGLTLFAVAALLLLGGAVAAGSGLVRLPSRVPPAPGPTLPAVVTSPTASTVPAPSATPAPVAPRAPSWTPTGSMSTPRSSRTATLLNDGTVLVTGGYNGNVALSSAERYDPRSGKWTPAGHMVLHTGRWYTATLLLDGRVLVAGGAGSTGYLAPAELYDPATGSWTITGKLVTPRDDPTATLLRDGRVLVAGGSGQGAVASAELYDPATGSWTETGSMPVRRTCALATLLEDGRVLVAGGADDGACAGGALASAAIYDPATGSWTATSSIPTQTVASSQESWAALLHDGRVLVGGNPNQLDDLLYDPASGSWTPTEGLPGGSSTGTVLRDGRVLATGCWPLSPSTASRTQAALYDPQTGRWTATASMGTPRSGASVTLLPDGRVLVAGGLFGWGQPGSVVASAELYDPGTGQ